MHLLFVIDHFGPGGAQRQIILLAKGLEKRKHHIEFFIYYPHIGFYRSLLKNSNIVIHSVTKKHRFSLSPIIVLRCLLKRKNYDIIVSFLSTPNLYSEIARLGLKKIKLVVSERSSLIGNSLTWRSRIIMLCHRFADYIVVNSNNHRERLAVEFPSLKKKLITIINGVDLEAFFPVKSSSAKKKGSFVKFLVVGRIGPEKNTIGLVRGLEILKKRFGRVPHISWVGRRDLSKNGKVYFNKLLRVMKESNIGDSWKWVGERSDINEVLNQHDALIHPSFYEGLPNAVCEALAAGKPALVSNICDNPILVKNGYNGFLFNPKEPESIADAIDSFMKLTPAVRIEMGCNARKFAEHNLSVELFLDRYESLLSDLVDSSY